MLDQYNRNITYLRISVTDKCNLKCTYCMPNECAQYIDNKDLLSLEEIYQIALKASELGVNKVRLTGGEPLVRKDIIEIVSKISSIEKIKDLTLTTNGVLLKKYAQKLADAGLKRVNISLDSVSPDKFTAITKVGKIQDVFEGIQAAKEAGLTPIKVNCVVEQSENEEDAIAVADFCKKNDLQVRYIVKMNLAKGIYHPVIGGEGGDCQSCNRIRVTADGKFKPCLFDEEEYSIRNHDITEVIKKTIFSKPKCGIINKNRNFYNIGG